MYLTTYLRLLRMIPVATAAPTTARAKILFLLNNPPFRPGQPPQVQLSPQLQAAPHVHVPLALAGQGPVELPHVPGQSAQLHDAPHLQFSPQLPVFTRNVDEIWMVLVEEL